jgi:predicted transcriptional regulator
MSVNPKWCEKIANGEKTIEVRKTKPNLQTPFKVYIYATKPKKWFRFSSWGYASDENLWLVNGKVKMCDGFEFWAGDKEYESLCCKVIGEFVCDRIDRIGKRGINNNFDYCYLSLNEWGNDDVEIEITDIQKSCISKSELNAYGANSSCLYAWHISQLKIYDKPKELSEFKKENRCYKKGDLDNIGCWERGCYMQEQGWCDGRYSVIERPPQSWCYVEQKK